MRPLPLVLLAAAAVAAASPAAAQQVRVMQRAATSARTDSLVKRIYDSDVAEVKRMVTAWREREQQLVQELRTTDDARRRRFEEELAHHVRDGFAMMSAIQARCVDGGGELPAGYLGLNIETQARLLNNQLREVVTTVTSVEPGSPAERAGVQRGDRVVRLGGLPPDRLGEIGDLLVPGRSVVLRLERDGTARDLPIVVARRPQGFGESCGEFERALMPMRVPGTRIVTEGHEGNRARVLVESRTVEPRAEGPGEMRFFIFGPGTETRTAIGFYAGAEFRALDADWSEVLGVKQGVIVSAVAAGSPAATSGLKNGDVITAVGATPVVSPTTLVQLLGSTEASEATLSVVRARERKTVTLRLAPR